MPDRPAAEPDPVAAFPDPHPHPALPDSVRVYEVGPRDGLQAERTIVPTETKIAFIDRLAAAGLVTIETTSFVSPRWVPQLADADAVCDRLERRAGVRYPCLVPNARGLERAVAAGVDDIAVFVSATERFARENLGTSRDGALAMARPVIEQALLRRWRVRGYVSMCFGDPWEGRVEPTSVVEVTCRLLELGCQQISLGDTIGVATPGHVRAVVASLDAAGVPGERIALHFHDTYGQALANVLAGLAAGVREFDASAGGMGGCPFARSATGNLATEDLVWMLEGLGYDTGVDLDALVRTSLWMAQCLGRPAPSRVVQARSRSSR